MHNACRACLFGGAIFSAGIAAEPAMGQRLAFGYGFGEIIGDRVSGTDPALFQTTDGPFGFGALAYSAAGMSASISSDNTGISFTHNRSSSAQFSYSLCGTAAYLAALQPTLIEVTWSLGTWAYGDLKVLNHTLADEVVFEAGGQPSGMVTIMLEEGFVYAAVTGTWGAAPGGNSSGSIRVVEPCAGDIDANGLLNVDDVQMFVDSFLGGCP